MNHKQIRYTAGSALIRAFVPAILFFLVSCLVSWIAEIAAGKPSEYATACNVITALICLPYLLREWKEDRIADRMEEAVDSKTVHSKTAHSKNIHNSTAHSKTAHLTKKVCFFLLAGVCGAVFSLLSSELMQRLGMYDHFSNAAQEALLKAPFWLQLTGLGFIIPVAEEFVFRGLMYSRLRALTSPVAAAALTSVFFAVGHGNVIQMVYAFPASLIMVWCMERGGISMACGFHIGANLLSVFVSL